MKIIDHFLRISENYVRNREFAHAVLSYERVVGCLFASCDMGDRGALDGLSHVNAEMTGMNGSPHAVAGLRSPVHDVLVSTYGRKISDGLDHFIGFTCPGTNYWVVSYHARKRLVLEDCWVPMGQPKVFTLVSTETGVVAWPVPDLALAQLSYLLAHIGYAHVEEALELYRVHQILDDSGIPMILAAARFLDYALALKPNNAWAYARLGEVYRQIANGWPGSRDSLFDPESCVVNYVKALLYYQEALNLAADSPGTPWVRAHLGAAIVNVRAFSGVFHKPDSPALDALLVTWYSRCHPGDIYQRFTQRAQSELIQALRESGNYYPWAEDYYGATLFFDGIIAKDTNLAVELTMLGFFNVGDSAYLRSSMLTSSFEPGELYVSPFLQWGLFTFWLKQFERAWVFTRNGMARLFKYHFLPGVDALQGFQILVNIAVNMMERGSGGMPENGDPSAQRPQILELLNSELGPDFGFGGVQIPESPIVDRQTLIDFIQEIIIRIGVQAVSLVLPTDIALNTTIQMSLVQVSFVFMNFQQILQKLGGDTTVVSKWLNKITAKLDIEIPEVDYNNHMYHVVGAMLTGKPTYKMVACIQTLQRKHPSHIRVMPRRMSKAIQLPKSSVTKKRKGPKKGRH